MASVKDISCRTLLPMVTGAIKVLRGQGLQEMRFWSEGDILKLLDSICPLWQKLGAKGRLADLSAKWALELEVQFRSRIAAV